MNKGWSDGRERADGYEGDALSMSIQAYFADARDEKLLELKWENEEYRRILREGDAWAAPALQSKAAAGAR
jgi:hypothetical protein